MGLPAAMGQWTGADTILNAARDAECESSGDTKTSPVISEQACDYRSLVTSSQVVLWGVSYDGTATLFTTGALLRLRSPACAAVINAF